MFPFVYFFVRSLPVYVFVLKNRQNILHKYIGQTISVYQRFHHANPIHVTEQCAIRKDV